MKTTQQHTPTPYKVEYQQYEDGSHVCAADQNGDWVADFGKEGDAEAESNAIKFVTAVNNHFELLEALKDVYTPEKTLGYELRRMADLMDSGELIESEWSEWARKQADKAEAAIQKATQVTAKSK